MGARDHGNHPSKVLEMPAPFWAKPRFVVPAILVYLALHLAIRMAIGPSLSVDDTFQSLFSQRYAWAYGYRTSPLPAWMMATIAYVLPVNAFSNSLQRYALLGIFYLFVYLTARRLIADPRLSALALYSFAAIGSFAESSHHNLTHSTALAAMLAVAWYVFLRLAAAPRLGWYLALGAIFAFGPLAKWNFAIFAASLPLACLTTRETRSLVLTWKVLPAAAVTAAMVLPTLLATLAIDSGGQGLLFVLQAEGGPSLARAVAGSLKLLEAVIIFALPFYLITAAILGLPVWRGLRRLRGGGGITTTTAEPQPAPSDGTRPFVIVIGVTMAIGLALLWGIVLVLGATEFKVRYLYPVLPILPVWVFMLIERGRPSARALQLFALVMAALVVFVAGKRLTLLKDAGDCGICLEWRPYGVFAEQISQAGFAGEGTILTDGVIGGNMRTHFPNARIIVPTDAPESLPAPSGTIQCLLIWPAEEDIEIGETSLPHLEAHLVNAQQGTAEAPHQDGTAAAPMHEPVDRTFRIHYRLYDEPNGDCR